MVICAIPARYEASRFPGKLMQDLGGKTVIRRVYEASKSAKVFDRVVVVTDSEIIYNEIVSSGGEAIMSIGIHESGTDRIAEALENIEATVIVNVQGDTPFIKPGPLKKLVAQFDDPEVQVASMKQKLPGIGEALNPNVVKVVTDYRNDALYFSRSVIPYQRNPKDNVIYYEHVGVYAFRKNALMNFTKWPISPLEHAEKNEALRHLENGVRIRMIETEYMGVQIDTPEDLAAARIMLENF